jgi:glycosyltransferase involved in cell wall biosynthesis
VHRLLHVRRDRVRVVPLAARPAFGPAPDGGASRDPGPDAGPAAATDPGARHEIERLGLPDRYLVYPGRYDARQDLSTLLAALAALGAAGRPRSLPVDVPWPPRVLLVGASPGDRAALARAAGRAGVGDALAYAPVLPQERLAGLIRGARAVILPALSEGAGLGAIEAIACGTPVVATSVGALPEIVGGAGILVEPRDDDRLAAALRTIWVDERAHRRLAGHALTRARAPRRTWSDVALETRRIYADVGVRRSR